MAASGHIAKCKAQCILPTSPSNLTLENAAMALALLLLNALMNFFKAMQYWISNFNQAWADLWEIMSFAPALTLAASIMIFVWGVRVLMINSTHASIREWALKLLISFYAVGCCWGIAFAVCLIFVSPIQVYHQRSATSSHFSQPAPGRNLQSNPANDYAKNMADGEIPLDGKGTRNLPR